MKNHFGYLVQLADNGVTHYTHPSVVSVMLVTIPEHSIQQKLKILMQFSKDLARFMRFLPLLLSNLKKKSPEECASEHNSRTGNSKVRVTHQLVISSKNQAHTIWKIPSCSTNPMWYINSMPLWCGVLWWCVYLYLLNRLFLCTTSTLVLSTSTSL